MPSAKPAATKTTAKKSTGPSGGSLARTIGPAIPLGIALLHGAMAGRPATAPAGAAALQAMSVSANSLAGVHCGGGTADSPACPAPYPMLAKGHPVDWWFVFKLNAGKFPKCGSPSSDGAGDDTRTCLFDAGRQPTAYSSPFGQRYVVASSEAEGLADGGPQCLGTATSDPVGASFDEVYHGAYHYVIWNDQTYNDPEIGGCSGTDCGAPWGHSKGLVAWNDAGEGFVMQVSTPSWPMAGSPNAPRKTDGNTLGCVKDNDVEVSQHFFALRLTEPDLEAVLTGLGNASVVTDPHNPQIVNNGGPARVQQLVTSLGVESHATTALTTTLSTGVQFISKPSDLQVPPWQMVSSLLGGVSLRAATWWAAPAIPATVAGAVPGCWSSTLPTAPGAVDIAHSGSWNNTVFSLDGGPGSNKNHAKVGVSTSGTAHYAIFGDMNQQGTLSGNCKSSQNGRGGMFFVVNDASLAAGLTELIADAPADEP